MTKPRALYYRSLSFQPENMAALREAFDLVELDDPRQDSDDILAGIDVLFAPLGYRVDKDKLDRCPRLRAIASNTTGIPHIDAPEANRRGIAVCALHDEPAFLDSITPTAEHTIGLMLAAWRRIPAAHAAASDGQWTRRPWGAPRMMSRMRLGLVGFGRLGQKVARVAEAMGMNTSYYDPGKPGSVASLEKLARQSDVLSLHAPSNSTTQGMISREVLEALPQGALVVNTARGELLDTDALLDLLASGHIYAAALDTVAGEYAPGFGTDFRNSRLAEYARTHDTLILTPHIGGSTIDAWRKTERFVIDKARRVFDE